MRLSSTSLLVAVLALAACTGASHRTVAPPTTTSAPTTSRATAPVARCSARAPQPVPPNQVPGSTSTFVPGAPRTLVACRYHGFNQREPVGTLAATARFAPEPFVTALNRAPHVPNGAVFHCPLDAAEVIVLHFGYANGETLAVTVSTQGCGFASNGDLRIRTPATVLDALQARLGRDSF